MSVCVPVIVGQGGLRALSEAGLCYAARGEVKAGGTDGELVSVWVWSLVTWAQCGRREGLSRGQLAVARSEVTVGRAVPAGGRRRSKRALGQT